jgi:hypothetical protein
MRTRNWRQTPVLNPLLLGCSKRHRLGRQFSATSRAAIPSLTYQTLLRDPDFVQASAVNLDLANARRLSCVKLLVVDQNVRLSLSAVLKL